MTVVVRAATRDDAEAIAQVHVEGWRWGYRGVMPDAFLEALSVDARAARWRDILGRDAPRERTWIASDARSCGGFASIGPARGEPPEVGELYAIYVAERCAGRGLAPALMRRALSELRSDGYARAILWVLADNPRARRFYERHGWRADGGSKRESLGGVELDELRYAIALDASVDSAHLRAP